MARALVDVDAATEVQVAVTFHPVGARPAIPIVLGRRAGGRGVTCVQNKGAELVLAEFIADFAGGRLPIVVDTDVPFILALRDELRCAAILHVARHAAVVVTTEVEGTHATGWRQARRLILFAGGPKVAGAVVALLDVGAIGRVALKAWWAGL